MRDARTVVHCGSRSNELDVPRSAVAVANVDNLQSAVLVLVTQSFYF